MRVSRLVLSTLAVLLFSVPAVAAVNRIAAVVNGEMITTYDLEAEMLPEMVRLKLDPKNPANAAAIDDISRKVLDSMINGIILTQEAVRLKVMVSEAEIDAELQQFLQRSKLTPEEFARQLQLQRLTEKSFRKRIQDRLLRNQLLAMMVGRKVVVTKEEIARYYDAHQATFMNNQNVRFALIVYPPSVNAEKYAAQIASGKSFEAIAREVSVGPRAKEGGDLGTLAWSELDPMLREHLSTLKTGGVSPLFELNGLKGQMKLLARTDGSGQSLEEASPQIEAILREPKLQERFAEYTDQLRKRAVVTIRQ